MTSPRRTFLKRSGTALFAGALAGCISDESGSSTDTPDGTGGDDTGTPTATATPAPAPTDTDAETATATDTEPETPTATPDGALATANYTAWLPAPDQFETRHYTFATIAPRALVAMKDDLGEGAVSEFESETRIPGIDTYATVDALHVVGSLALVFETAVDVDQAKTGLSEFDVSEVAARQGFSVFAGSGGAAAVREDALVSALGLPDEATARSAVEGIVDARAGATDRYADAVADCAALTDALGTGHLVRGRTHEPGASFDGAVATGLGIDVGPDQTRVETPVVFREGEASEGPVLEWASSAAVFYGTKPASSTDGRVVTASTTVQSDSIGTFHSTLPGSTPSGTSEAPQISFGFEYEETGDGVGIAEITHEGGDSVSRSQLFVRGTGFTDVEGADQTSAGQWAGTASGDDDAVVAGDAVSVGVASDYELRVVWESADGDTSATLVTHDGPDA